jgi:hypothetical protein
MSRESRSRSKAIITAIVVLLATALIAYFVFFRPVEEDPPPGAPETETMQPRETPVVP